MSSEIVQTSTYDAVKAVMEVGGPQEINGLARELNGMSQTQLESLGRALPAIYNTESVDHPNLPRLSLDEGGSGHGSTSTTDINIVEQGKSEPIYHRQFQTDGKSFTDIQFDPFTDKITGEAGWSGPEKHSAQAATKIEK